jgi:serine/threonine protein kinase
MENASGGELFELLAKRGKLKEKDARYLFQQMISGIN